MRIAALNMALLTLTACGSRITFGAARNERMAPIEESQEIEEPQEMEKVIKDEDIVLDYAEVLRNSEQFDGRTVTVAGRIGEFSQWSDNTYSFTDRLGKHWLESFDVKGSSELGDVRELYQVGDYVLVKGRWRADRLCLYGDVVSKGAEAKQYADTFLEEWYAEGWRWAESLPLTQYMELVNDPEKYEGQRVRVTGRLTQDSWFQDPRTGRDCLKICLNGCPPEMREPCKEGAAVILSGVLHISPAVEPRNSLVDCFIECAGPEAEEPVQAMENAWWQQYQEERKAYLAACEPYDYEQGARFPQEYKGKRVEVSGTVIQAGKYGDFVIDTGDGRLVDISYYSKQQREPEILKGDWVVFYGTSNGKTSYIPPQGLAEEIPSVDPEYSSMNQ